MVLRQVTILTTKMAMAGMGITNLVCGIVEFGQNMLLIWKHLQLLCTFLFGSTLQL